MKENTQHLCESHVNKSGRDNFLYQVVDCMECNYTHLLVSMISIMNISVLIVYNRYLSRGMLCS